jgi:hypothetical protein
VTSLGQLGARIEAVDAGEEVGGIEQQAAQVEAEAGDGGGTQVVLDPPDRLLVQAVHVVPEALAGELRGPQAYKTGQHGRLVPCADARLAARGDAPIEDGHEQVLAHGRSPRALLGHVAVDRRSQIKLLGQIETGGGGAELANDGLVGCGVGEPANELRGRAEVLLTDNRRFAVYPLAFAEVVVGPAADDLLGEARHGLGHTAHARHVNPRPRTWRFCLIFRRFTHLLDCLEGRLR